MTIPHTDQPGGQTTICYLVISNDQQPLGLLVNWRPTGIQIMVSSYQRQRRVHSNGIFQSTSTTGTINGNSLTTFGFYGSMVQQHYEFCYFEILLM